jgi:hypothetical protein
VFAALEVLPKIGYAIPTAQHPAAWQCEVTTPSAEPARGTPFAPGATIPAPGGAPDATARPSPPTGQPLKL